MNAPVAMGDTANHSIISMESRQTRDTDSFASTPTLTMTEAFGQKDVTSAMEC